MIRIRLEVDAKAYEYLCRVISTFQTSPQQYLPNTLAEYDNFINGTVQTLENYFRGTGKLADTDPIPDKYRKSTNSLVQSIKVQRNGANPFKTSIQAESPVIQKIEQGQNESEFDMKTVYPFGPKSRVARDKNGKVKSNYLIICFRWGASGDESAHFSNTIPTKVYRTQTSNMSVSFRTGGMHPEENSKGQAVMRNEYIWGDRVDDANAIAIEKSRVWKGQQLTRKITNTGMVRMRNDAGGSSFVTFRVISTKSPKDSWIRRMDPIKPIDISTGLNKTIELMKPMLEKRMKEAAKMDILRLINKLKHRR